MFPYVLALLIIIAGFASAAVGENPLLDPLGGDWQIGHKQARGGTSIIEFVHAGESVQNWTELATLLSMDEGKGMNLDEYVARVRAQMQTRCPRGPSVRVLSKKSVSGLPARLIAVECRAYANGSPESFVQMAVAGRQALYSLQLARKVGRLDAPTVTRFSAFVGKLKICDDTVASRPCTR
jgi:hypothetical protein